MSKSLFRRVRVNHAVGYGVDNIAYRACLDRFGMVDAMVPGVLLRRAHEHARNKTRTVIVVGSDRPIGERALVNAVVPICFCLLKVNATGNRKVKYPFAIHSGFLELELLNDGL